MEEELGLSAPSVVGGPVAKGACPNAPLGPGPAAQSVEQERRQHVWRPSFDDREGNTKVQSAPRRDGVAQDAQAMAFVGTSMDTAALPTGVSGSDADVLEATGTPWAAADMYGVGGAYSVEAYEPEDEDGYGIADISDWCGRTDLPAWEAVARDLGAAGGPQVTSQCWEEPPADPESCVSCGCRFVVKAPPLGTKTGVKPFWRHAPFVFGAAAHAKFDAIGQKHCYHDEKEQQKCDHPRLEAPVWQAAETVSNRASPFYGWCTACVDGDSERGELEEEAPLAQWVTATCGVRRERAQLARRSREFRRRCGRDPVNLDTFTQDAFAAWRAQCPKVQALLQRRNDRVEGVGNTYTWQRCAYNPSGVYNVDHNLGY